MNLIEPTEELVDNYKQKFKENDYYIGQNLLDYLFGNIKNNDNLQNIEIKVFSVSYIYNAKLKTRKGIINYREMAEKILNKNMDDSLGKGNENLVNNIADTRIGKLISFASKYCHFHFKEYYPIYDSNAWKTLSEYNNIYNYYPQLLGVGYIDNYALYKEMVVKFRSYFNLNNVQFRELDHFLWLYGNELKKAGNV